MSKSEKITADGTVETLVHMLKNIGVEYIDGPVAREIIKANLEAAALAGARAMQATLKELCDERRDEIEMVDPATVARQAVENKHE